MTVAFDPSDDFTAMADAARPVTLARPGTSLAASLAHALPRTLTRREAEASGGLYTQTDVVWHLGAAELAEPPQPGDLLVEPSGARWTVLAVAQAAAGSRWRCVCRALAIARGLDRYVDVLHAVFTKGQHGALVPQWRTWRTGVPGRIQPVAVESTGQVNSIGATVRYVVYLDLDDLLDPTHRLRAPDGTLLAVLGSRKPERLDALLEVQAAALEMPGDSAGEY